MQRAEAGIELALPRQYSAKCVLSRLDWSGPAVVAPAERLRPLCRSGELVVSSSFDGLGPLAYPAAWHGDFWTIFVVRKKLRAVD
jgi:hypothetical protein